MWRLFALKRISVGDVHLDPSDNWVSTCYGKTTVGEQDEQSLALESLDISRIKLEHTGDESENDVSLDARFCIAFLANKQLIPRRWRKEGNIFFGGTKFVLRTGNPCVLGLGYSPYAKELWGPITASINSPYYRKSRVAVVKLL